MSTIVRKSPVPKRVKPNGTSNAPPSKAEPRADPTALVTVIPLECLHRHADNRVITEASVEELADSLRTFGQKEPIRVRELDDPIGHYEILSGERRFVAAGVAGLDSMKCLIENHDGPEALLELAVANTHREDLDPIERAELLARLIAPQMEGGAGMAKAEAGKIFSLNSESGVKNALRLLSLPKFFRDLLKSKSINVKQARALVPYPDSLLAAYAKWLTEAKNKYSYEDFLMSHDEGELEWALERFIRQATRPVDKLVKHNHGYQLGGDYPCLFAVDNLDEAKRKSLSICEIPYREGHGENAKSGVRLVSLNPSAWHKLQDPLVKTANEARTKTGKKTSKSSTAKNGESAKPSAAELKAKRKKQDEQLQHYTRDWICRALRYQLSIINHWTKDETRVLELLPWMLAASFDRGSLQQWSEWALAELIPQQKRVGLASGKTASQFQIMIDQVGHVKFYQALWRVVLWPATNNSHGHSDLSPPGTIPERMPGFSTREVHSLADACDVSMETIWMEARKDSMQKALVKQWLMRHNKEQLLELGKAAGLAIADGRRDDMVTQVLESHAKKPMKLPATIKVLK